MNRRAFGALGLLGLAGLSLPRLGRSQGPPKRGPRYVVQLFLRGGVDAVYTFDPKTRDEVEARVDVPYGPGGVREAGRLLLGPHFYELERHADRLAVLRGVQVKTANHESGAFQFLRMKAPASPDLPSLLDIIGRERDGQPLSSVTFGDIASYEYSQGHFGGPTADSDRTILDRIDKLGDGDAALLSRVYARHLEDLSGWAPGPQREVSRSHLQQVQALFARLEDVPRFKPTPWGQNLLGQEGKAGQEAAVDKISEDLQRALWWLENDLSRGVYVKVFLDWDSHFDNAKKQASATPGFAYRLGRFFDELLVRKNAHGRLYDNTLVVLGSELGRFPQINGNDGKDHFPETSLAFFGGAVRGSGEAGHPFGQTGRMMEGLPISLDTGRPADGGVLVNIDDVGTTLLGLCGIDPELVGYRGRHLGFLERA